MSELSIYPDDGLHERAEIHSDASTGELLAARVRQKVNIALGTDLDAPMHPRLTRGSHLDELHAVEEAVDRHVQELRTLSAEIEKVEKEVDGLRTLYRRLIAVGSAVVAVIVLVLVIELLVHR